MAVEDAADQRAVLGPRVQRVGGGVRPAEALAVADEGEEVGLLRVAQGQFAGGEEVDGVEVAEAGGGDPGEVLGVDDFEGPSFGGDLAEHLGGGVDRIGMAIAVGGGQVEDRLRLGLRGGSQQQDGGETQPAVLTQQRSTSATLQAWAMQPRGVYGASASKTSLIEPMHASSRCGMKPVEELGAPARSRRDAACSQASTIRADQPGPDGALMVGGVAGAQIAVVLGLVVGMARARASAGRRASAAAR